MKYLDRRKPYRIGSLWKIEYPREGSADRRWASFYSLWLYNTEWHKWQFVRLICEAEASCYGKKPVYV